MVFEIIVSLFAAFGVIMLLRIAYSMLLVPENKEGCAIFVVIRVKGKAPGLQQIVQNTLNCDEAVRVVLYDAGMDDETASMAGKLAYDNGIEICREDILCELIEQE
jgi:hypothetical protein